MAMGKKNYEKAARIVQAWREAEIGEPDVRVAGKALKVSSAIEEAFVLFFKDDNPRFAEHIFRQACRK